MRAHERRLYSKISMVSKQMEIYYKRKENGLCVRCGKKLDREGVYCILCRKYTTEQNTLSRHWYQEHGICPRCRKNTLFGDEKMCPECSAKEYEFNIRNRAKLGKEYCNKQHNEWARNEHQRRISEGICTRCGKRKADGGYKTCGICRAKMRNYKRIKYGKPDREERFKQELCYFCGNRVKVGYKVCEKHYQMNIEKSYSQKAKEARKKLIENGILY